MIYLDHQATTPVDPRVLQAMLPYLTGEFGNPSSSHAHGRRAATAIERAREQVAHAIGARPTEIVFTGSGTEATYLALLGLPAARRDHGDHIVTTALEHPATAGACGVLADAGYKVTTVPVGPDGLVDPTDVEAAVTDRTVLVTMIHAQNEIGTVQPVTEVAELAHRHGALLHIDAAHSLPAMPVDVAALGADLVTVVGHKMYAPKGIGALYVREGVDLVPQFLGGGQERGLRAATENVPGIVGLGRAAQLLGEQREADAARILRLRDRLHERLEEAIPECAVNGSLTQRIPGNLNVRLPGVPADQLMEAVPDVAISAGAACHAGSTEPSAVLLAIGLSPEQARCSVRIGIGRFTTQAEIDEAGGLLADGARKLLPAAGRGR
ncbi:cysteine desulfurase [Actinomadura sp. KC216]|uniref:cysteine desulfurase family protein n=1 Tax=Actinomadura sp. KC216 TaxID=2530370 RepID=UPI001045949E|nr:cysteine desulfurase family protein [Actinomadura sp. KC216]TDB89017.1 cysteine desulfurase [Actinomadura sp. KC216]